MPLALDALGSYVLVAFAPLELTLLHVVMTGALSPNGTPTAKIQTVRELSIMSVGQPITVSRLCMPSVASQHNPERLVGRTCIHHLNRLVRQDHPAGALLCSVGNSHSTKVLSLISCFELRMMQMYVHSCICQWHTVCNRQQGPCFLQRYAWGNVLSACM